MAAPTTRPRRRRGARAGWGVAALALSAAALVVLLPGAGVEPRVAARVTSASGALSMSNSAGAGAVLQAEGMTPGSAVEGAVTIANTGELDGALELAVADLVDVPGPADAPLSARLRLEIDDVSAPGAPVRVYAGPLAGARSMPLGAFPAAGARSFRFVASLPATGDDNAYQGARATVRLDWTATADAPAGGVGTGPRRGRAALRVPRGQRPLRDGRLFVLTRCAARCHARVALSVDLPGTGRRRAATTARRLAPGRARLTLRLSRRSLRAIRARLARGGSVRGRLTLDIRDGSGRRTRATRRVRFALVR